MISRHTTMVPKQWRPAVAVAMVAIAVLIAPISPTYAGGELSYPINGANTAYGNNNVYYGARFDLGTLNAGNITQTNTNVPGSNALDSLDGQITGSPNLAAGGNSFEWAAGILDYDGGYFGGRTATINIPAHTTVSGVYSGNGWGFAAGILANLNNGGSGNPVFNVNNSGTVSAATNNNEGVAVGLNSYVNYGDQHITNNAYGNFNAAASWYTTGIRALSNGGSVFVNQYGSLNATSSGSFQSPYDTTTGKNPGSRGWAVGLDLQTFSGNITVANTGASTGTVKSEATSASEACGAYIWANGGNGLGSANGNMTFNNSGTFTANGAPTGAVKGVYCGGNGSLVTISNSGTISATAGTGGFGWALMAELDANGTMNINNTGTMTTNGSSGLYIVSTTNSDPNSGGTGPVRVENWGTIEGPAGLTSNYYNGPITVYDHGTITGSGGSAISLNNSRPDKIYLYGTPRINGSMWAATAGSTLTLHIPASISAISGGNGNQDSNLANDGLGASGSITAGGKTYSWSNLTVGGAFAKTDIANGTYVLQNRNSGLVMAEPSSQTANGTRIGQWPLNSSNNAPQKWRITNLGNGLYKIINAASGRALDDNGGNTANGAIIDVRDYANQGNQHWIFTATDSGFYTLSPADAPGSCLDIPGATKNQGTFLQLYTLANADTQPSGGAGQQWSLVKQ